MEEILHVTSKCYITKQLQFQQLILIIHLLIMCTYLVEITCFFRIWLCQCCNTESQFDNKIAYVQFK